MSTKIYNGIKFKSSNIKEVLDQLIKLKKVDWMTWENKGLYSGELNYGWDIDHIIPLSTAKTEEDVIKLNHYTNLKPLYSKINTDFKNKYIQI